MNTTHNSGYDKPEQIETKRLWCRICKSFQEFFKCGTHFWCSSCRYAEGTDSELTVMDE